LIALLERVDARGGAVGPHDHRCRREARVRLRADRQRRRRRRSSRGWNRLAASATTRKEGVVCALRVVHDPILEDLSPVRVSVEHNVGRMAGSRREDHRGVGMAGPSEQVVECRREGIRRSCIHVAVQVEKGRVCAVHVSGRRRGDRQIVAGGARRAGCSAAEQSRDPVAAIDVKPCCAVEIHDAGNAYRAGRPVAGTQERGQMSARRCAADDHLGWVGVVCCRVVFEPEDARLDIIDGRWILGSP